MNKALYLYEKVAESYLKNSVFLSILRENNIKILNGFETNNLFIKKFYDKFYSSGFPQTILCGINPGKNGAGKTGIPFIDFNSLAKIFPEVDRFDIERSATFIFKLIQFFGIENFFKNFYLTNFSFLGFTKENRNQNYYDLPPEAKDIINYNFIAEIEIIKPKNIIALSGDVFNSVQNILSGRNITIEYLPHPYYCSFISREKEKLKLYIQLLNNFITSKSVP